MRFSDAKFIKSVEALVPSLAVVFNAVIIKILFLKDEKVGFLHEVLKFLC